MSAESRKRHRREPTEGIQVTDTMTGAMVGRMGNLSETGMLLVATTPLREDALYQFRFSLPGAHGTTELELGAHLLWFTFKDPPGASWAGFRFIGVSEEASQRLRSWVEAGHR